MINLWELFGELNIAAIIHQKTNKYPKLSQELLDALSPQRLSNPANGSYRLAHSRSIERPELDCCEWTKKDTVECFYVFGETLLVSTHPVGKCPWKLL